MIYVATVILAFCSITYELLLGQTLSAFLGNTVLRYSVTVGLYMFSMGLGALLADGEFRKNPLKNLILIELCLTAIGGFSVVLMFSLTFLNPPAFIFSLVAHSLIIIIGILTGFEIPLLIYLRNQQQQNTENSVLGVDYLGAFAGTVAFAMWLYPSFGLVPTAFLIGALNGFVGLVLCLRWGYLQYKVDGARFMAVACTQLLLLAGIVTCLYNSQAINSYLVSKYLNSSLSETA